MKVAIVGDRQDRMSQELCFLMLQTSYSSTCTIQLLPQNQIECNRTAPSEMFALNLTHVWHTQHIYYAVLQQRITISEMLYTDKQTGLFRVRMSLVSSQTLVYKPCYVVCGQRNMRSVTFVKKLSQVSMQVRFH